MGKSKQMPAHRICVLVLCAAVLVSLCVLVSFLLRSRSGCEQREEDGRFPNAAVAADSLTCSRIGRDVLEEGGSAVDAAIAALVCTSLVNPQSMGLGGGSIFTIMDKHGKVMVINSRETVPAHVNPDLLKNCPKTMQLVSGAKWIGVPGEVRGYAKAHELYGKLPWARLFEPSIRLAREGFIIPPYLAELLQNKQVKTLVENSSLCFSEVFCGSNKKVLVSGDTLRYPALAQTLQLISQHKDQVFYSGQIAQDLMDDVRAEGGSLSLEDLKSYQVRVSDASSIPVGEYTMHFPPPPAGGALISFILNVMHGFGLSPSSLTGEREKETLHRYIETLKFANGQRTNIRDPRYSSKKADHLTDPNFVDRIRSMISDSAHQLSYYNVTQSPDQPGTTHVSVLARDGSAVSVTSTINHFFGSLVYSPKTGITLNNELVDFCGRADSIPAGEQPPSSMSPVIIHTKNRDKVLVIGGSGGSMITTGMATSIINHLWLGKSLRDAICTKVVHVGSQNAVMFEPGFSKELIESTRSLGHDVTFSQYFFNAVNGVSKDHGCISAFSDARKNSKAAGY